MQIELVYDRDCPHARVARLHLSQALREENLPMTWTEWDRSDVACPPAVQCFGSPAILVEGRDVEGLRPTSGAACCRRYTSTGGETGAPSVDLIRTALRLGTSTRKPCS